MEMKKELAGWNKICPGCDIGRKYPNSFIGKKVREHWEKGCSAITHMSRFTAAMSLARQLSAKNPKINNFVGGLCGWNVC